MSMLHLISKWKYLFYFCFCLYCLLDTLNNKNSFIVFLKSFAFDEAILELTTYTWITLLFHANHRSDIFLQHVINPVVSFYDTNCYASMLYFYSDCIRTYFTHIMMLSCCLSGPIRSLSWHDTREKVVLTHWGRDKMVAISQTSDNGLPPNGPSSETMMA